MGQNNNQEPQVIRLSKTHEYSIFIPTFQDDLQRTPIPSNIRKQAVNLVVETFRQYTGFHISTKHSAQWIYRKSDKPAESESFEEYRTVSQRKKEMDTVIINLAKQLLALLNQGCIMIRIDSKTVFVILEEALEKGNQS